MINNLKYFPRKCKIYSLFKSSVIGHKQYLDTKTATCLIQS